MESSGEIGAMIFEACGTGNLAKLDEINTSVGDDVKFRKICDEYSDSSTGRRVLNQAAEMGYVDICEFLIETMEVDIEVVTYKGDTPLIGAAKENHLNIVQYLIAQDAQLEAANWKGFTSLHYAVLNDNRDLVEWLLSNVAPIEADSVDGTPLHCAASRGNVEILQLLLAYGAKRDLMNLFCGSPLLCAIKSHSFECVDHLLTIGADPNKFSYGLTPLAQATKYLDTRFLIRLLEAGAQPNKRSTGFLKPIVEAALANNIEAVGILFPLTVPPIPHYPDWSVAGIMAYAHSEDAARKRAESWSRHVKSQEKPAEGAVKTKKYAAAIRRYSEASYLEPANPKWVELRSMCSAHMGRGVDALRDIEECIRLNAHRTREIEPHYRLRREGDVDKPTPTMKLYKKYYRASLQLTLAPEKKNLDAFRVAMFEYFSLLHMMSSPQEMATFIQHFR